MDMARAHAYLLPARQLLAVVSLVLAVLSSGVAPVHADSLASTIGGTASPSQAVTRALRNYGWRPDAIAFMLGHTHVVETQAGLDGPCPADVACSLRDGSVYLNLIPDDPATLDYVLNHEFIHAMEFARGSADSSIGPILADLLTLSLDNDHPLAAEAARRALSLTGQNDHPVIAERDWFHLEHYVLEDVGWDVANLPDWYRDAYFPYLMPSPPVHKAVAADPEVQPRDWDLRMQRVLDAIVTMCGPVLPGARLSAPSVSCDQKPLWSGLPYTRMAGGVASSTLVATASASS